MSRRHMQRDALQAAAATAERALRRLLEAEQVVDAATALFRAYEKDDQKAGAEALELMRAALDNYEANAPS